MGCHAGKLSYRYTELGKSLFMKENSSRNVKCCQYCFLETFNRIFRRDASFYIISNLEIGTILNKLSSSFWNDHLVVRFSLDVLKNKGRKGID